MQKHWRTQLTMLLNQQARYWKLIDIEPSTPSSISQRCKLRSNIYWLTEFCNSQCISHFAAFFIINWAKTFIAKTHFVFRIQSKNKRVTKNWFSGARQHESACCCKPCHPRANAAEPKLGTTPQLTKSWTIAVVRNVQMILPQVHLQKPCYDFSFL